MKSCLDELFVVLNQQLFEGRLPRVSFVITNSRRHSLRFRGPDAIEIGLQFAELSPKQIFAGVVHEMVHLSNFVAGHKDCTRNQYHNLNFRGEAIRVGLIVSWDSLRGWGVTSLDEEGIVNVEKVLWPSPVTRERLLNIFANTLLSDGRLERLRQEVGKLISKESKSTQFKYVCKCRPPHNTIRCGRKPDGPNPLNATCNTCGGRFEVRQ